MEEAYGPVDKLKSKMAALQGEIEGLRGERDDLRLAGAGADVLGGIDQQINALRAQQEAIEDQSRPMQKMQDEMDKLQNQGQKLDLERDIKFDPLTRQIEQASKAYEEMPFDKIMAGVRQQQAAVADLTTQWKAADDAVNKQQVVVDNLKAARDALQITYDQEKDKLTELGKAYDGIENQIDAMTSAMDSFASAAKEAANAAKLPKMDEPSLNEQIFNAGGDFKVPGGNSTLGREGGLPEIEAFDQGLEEEYKKTLEDLGKIDMFGPLKDMWNKGWSWVKENIWPFVKPVWDGLKTAFSGIWDDLFGGADLGEGFGKGFEGVKQAWHGLQDDFKDSPFSGVVDALGDLVGNIGQTVGEVAGLVTREVWPVLKEIGGWFADAGRDIWNEIQKWGPLFDPFLEAFGHVWTVIAAIGNGIFLAIKGVLALILGIWYVVWPVLFNVVKPIFDGIAGLIVAAMEFLRGTIEIVLGIINGDWSLVLAGHQGCLRRRVGCHVQDRVHRLRCDLGGHQGCHRRHRQHLPVALRCSRRTLHRSRPRQRHPRTLRDARRRW